MLEFLILQSNEGKPTKVLQLKTEVEISPCISPTLQDNYACCSSPQAHSCNCKHHRAQACFFLYEMGLGISSLDIEMYRCSLPGLGLLMIHHSSRPEDLLVFQVPSPVFLSLIVCAHQYHLSIHKWPILGRVEDP